MDSSDEKQGALPRVLSALELLTEEELVQLNHRIVARLRLMQEIRAHGAMAELRLGQRVRFLDSAGRTIRGAVTRYNRKSVTVLTDAGAQWRVAPDLLKPE